MPDSREIAPARAASAAPLRVHDFALVVGVDHYPKFRSLQGAIHDATAFHAWTCDPDGGGVTAERARLVLSSPEPPAPLQDQIDEALVDLMTAANALGGGRRLYVYFAGHGATSPSLAGDDVALLLAKWSRTMARTALSTEEYQATLGGAGLFEELAIFLDCCRSVDVRAVGMPPMITFERTVAPCATRTFIAYATEAGQSAFEAPRPDGWSGVFTRCLLTALRQGISALALKHYLEREVSGPQQAHAVHGLHDDSVFGRAGARPQLTIELTRGVGKVRLRDGRRQVVAEYPADGETQQLSLEAGLYKLEDDAGRTLLIDHPVEEGTVVRF